jgi:hypothetical protein
MVSYMGRPLYFEFCSGNLNALETLPQGRLFKFLAILRRLLYVIVPIKHWVLCLNKFLRSLQTLALSNNVVQVALSVGASDIYYGSAFESDSSTELIRIIPASELQFSLPNLDQALRPSTVLKELILFHFRFYESVKMARKNLKGADQMNDVWDFWYQALGESGSGQLTSSILIGQAVTSLLSDFPQVRFIILPLEGRAWEKLVVRSCRDKVISIGFCHGAITGAHQGLLGPGMAKLFPPDYVVCVGHYFKQLLKKAGWSTERMFVTPYLRHRSKINFDSGSSGTKDLVVMLTGNRFISEYLINWLLAIDHSQVRLKVGLSKRATSYNYLSCLLDRHGLEEWDGELTENVVVLTRSVSALIELRTINIHSAFLRAVNKIDKTVCQYLDESLKVGMVIAESVNYSCAEIYDAIRAADLSGFDPSFYLERSDEAQVELVETVTMIQGLSRERTITSCP